MTHLEEKHPLAIRWFRGIGFPLLMIWSHPYRAKAIHRAVEPRDALSA
jgi:hypothetical protein